MIQCHGAITSCVVEIQCCGTKAVHGCHCNDGVMQWDTNEMLVVVLLLVLLVVVAVVILVL